MLLIENLTLEDALHDLGIINTLAQIYWVQQGYTVTQGRLIPKNAATGEDVPEVEITTWDNIFKQDDKFYFISPTPRFPNWVEWAEQYLQTAPKGIEIERDYEEIIR